MALRTVKATRYVTPLREGGSLPAIVEADDMGTYVVKFRGAGQGPLALVAELICGEMARVLGLPVPELVFCEIDPLLGRSEPDAEIRELLQASAGLNLALDYLPGSLMFDWAAGDEVSADLASRIVWFDAFIANVDRTARNPNLLTWHRQLYLIDHGAALYFQHEWPTGDAAARSAFAPIREHVLLGAASGIAEAGHELAPLLDEDAIERIVADVPAVWLRDPAERYVEHFRARLAAREIFEQEARRAHATHV